MDESKVKEEAKKIMDSFMNSLGEIELEDSFELSRDSCYREEGNGEEPDEDFRTRFFANAPNVKRDFVISQKGAWV